MPGMTRRQLRRTLTVPVASMRPRLNAGDDGWLSLYHADAGYLLQ